MEINILTMETRIPDVVASPAIARLFICNIEEMGKK